jgi:hypothetical protein
VELWEASRLIQRLKAAFPRMTLDEEEGELLLKEVTLLHDPLILNQAVDRIIRTSERFPTIAEIRAQYHAFARVKESTPALPTGPREPIPDWVHVWFWHTLRTRTTRQAARTTSRQPVEDRPPVPQRNFPQMANPGPDAYTMAEYHKIETEWLEAGAPKVGTVAEIFAKIA